MTRKIALTISLVVLVQILTSLPSTRADNSTVDTVQTHEEQIAQWRQARNDRLANDSGWLTLVGLEWLAEGENRLGSGSSSTIPMPGGPENWGVIDLEGDTLRYRPSADDSLLVDGEKATETLLVADSQGNPTVVSSGNLSFYVVFRESYALRIKDKQAPALLEFSGVPNFDFQPDWKFDARFIPAEEGQTIEIANVLGQLSASPVYGYVEFDRNGKTYRLLGLGDENSDSLWFLFADRTSGRETYGAGRYLYSDGLPVDGHVVVDFNKAYNPPCAFSDYATCPLTPQENRLDLAVTAGEKKYGSH